MTKPIRIIYIVGDVRFWERFYRNETFCCCGARIGECELWSKVDLRLSEKVQDYSPEIIRSKIRELLLYESFDHLKELSQSFLPLVISFYEGISEASGKRMILDSSKSPSWGKLLSNIPEFDVSFIHLERFLPDVASSWKRRVLLPEFFDTEVYMPVKTNLAILRTWIRVRVLARKLRNFNYVFLRYEDLCNKPNEMVMHIVSFLGIDWISDAPYYYKKNHAIAGNPIRLLGKKEISIRPQPSRRPDNISWFEFHFFRIVHKVSSLV